MFCAGLANVAAQPKPATISGGLLNGKATDLVKPKYPPEARSVRAEGTVNVQVTLDEDGNVMSASAVSGHPLLRAAAVQAARESKFSPTVLNGSPVKVTGVVVYKFSVSGSTLSDGGNPKSWFHVGSTLATLDGSPTLRYFSADRIAAAIPADWTEERSCKDSTSCAEPSSKRAPINRPSGSSAKRPRRAKTAKQK
jgi:TonB family protein